MTFYARGAAFERQVKRQLEDMGWIVIRSAGSHGIADLVACLKGSAPMFVSCRIHGVLGPLEREQLHDAAARAGAIVRLAHRPKRGKIELTIVNP